MVLRRRNLCRLGAVVLLPATFGIVLSPAALGDAGGPAVTTTVLLTQATYYWHEQVTNIGGTGVSPPTTLTDPTVPSGDVAVAGPEVNGQADKETYLEFDVSAVPPGSTVTSFVVSLPVDPSSSAQQVTPTGTTPPIIACTPQGYWSGGAQSGQSFSGKPADQCATDAPKFTSKDGKTYQADVASIAQGWLSGNNTGVAVADDPSNTSTAYQVVFGPSSAITQLTAQMTYIPPAPGTPVGNPEPDTTTTLAALPTESVTAPFIPSVLTPVAQTPTSPTTTVPAGKPGRSSALPPSALASATPPGGFWLAAVLLVAVLLSASLVLGDEPAAEPARSRRRLLLASTRRWQPGTGTASPDKEE